MTANQIFDLHRDCSETIGIQKQKFDNLESFKAFLLNGGIVPLLWHKSVENLPIIDQIWVSSGYRLPPHREKKLRKIFCQALKKIGIE